MARQDIRSRLQGEDPNRRNLRKRLSEIGNYNLTHRKGEPIGKFNATHVAGERSDVALRGRHDPKLDIPGQQVNRSQAQPGAVPGWVLAAMQRRERANPASAAPVKPTGPNPLASGTTPLAGVQIAPAQNPQKRKRPMYGLTSSR